jgi:hypothetical protein
MDGGEGIPDGLGREGGLGNEGGLGIDGGLGIEGGLGGGCVGGGGFDPQACNNIRLMLITTSDNLCVSIIDFVLFVIDFVLHARILANLT